MPHLSLFFLGGFEVTLGNEPVTRFGADKVQALLAFLAIESSRSHRREKLAAMFWPDLSQKKAAHNLSQSLFRLRKALREKKKPIRSSFLLVTPQDIQFNTYSDYQLDVARFGELLNLYRQHHHPEAARCEVCAQWLLQAAELYRGDLLAGLFVPDSIAFEEWRLIQQEEFHRQALEILNWLAVYHEQRGEFERVQAYARRQIALEPWREAAHVQLMRALAQNGQTAAALRQYEQYQRTLAEELGIKPSSDVTRLYEQIHSGEMAPQTVTQPGIGGTVWLSTQGERRQVTTLVCNVTARADPEEIQEQMALCERYCQGIYHRFGGQRVPRQGNACLVYFGYPQAHEDAARRAVHAGLAVAGALADDESVRIGIHTGVMLAGEKRGPRWQDRDLVGTAFEIARDCQRQAKPGQVVISADTQRLVQESFDLQPLEPPIVGASGQLVQLYQVRGGGDLPGRLDWLAQTQRLTAFTGREEEMSQLKTCRDRALQGAGQVVFLSGEPGIGKSRLIWELKKSTAIIGNPTTSTPDNQQPVLWLASRGLPHYQNTSLHPMIGLLEQLLGFQTDDSLEVRRDKLAGMLAWYKLDRPSAAWLLSLLLGLPTDTPAPETMTKAQREQMREVFIALLQKRAAEQPMVLVIEDLQWSDPSTVDWLGRSIDALAAIPCLTLLSARPGFNPLWLSHEDLRPNLRLLALDPLRPEQAEQMVTNLAGENILDEEVRRHIVAKTDGIPLFVEELTKTLVEHPVFKGRANRMAEIPATLLDSLAARLDRLGIAKETAQWAAVFGREFSYPVLQACAPYDEQRLQSDLARLIEGELVSPIRSVPQNAPAPTRYAFKHALMQEAAYASLLKRTRQAYHRRIAEILEARFPQIAETRPEILADHYASAGMPTQAVDFRLLAGKRAMAQGATLEALTFFNRALQGIEPVDQERRWQLLLGREAVLYLREEREAQKKDIKALLELAEARDDDEWRAQALMRQAYYGLRLKNFQLMLSASEAAIAAAGRAGNRTIEVQGLATKVTALAYIGEWAAAQQAAEETLAKLPGVSDDVVQAYILGDLGFYYSRIGDSARALLLMYRGAEAARRVGNRQKESRLNLNIGFVSAQLGRYAEARAAFESGLALTEAIGDEAAQTSHRYNLSYVLWCSGDQDRARVEGEQALLEFRTAGHNTLGHACCLAYLGIYHEDAGDLNTAATYLAEARTLYASIGAKSYRMEAQALEARCMLALGKREEARQLAIEVWAYLYEHGTEGMDFPSRVYVCLADVFGAIEIPGISVREVIEMGYRELIKRAEKISDTDWRHSFLENVVENKALVERWKKISKAGPPI